jgi:triosephosphate isomerase (TIM)
MYGSPARRPLVAGNWKMNGLAASLEELKSIASGVQELGGGFDAVICPPATLIAAAASSVERMGLAIGAQDCSTDERGAFTGDVSAEMLADSGARYVIVGHSERRQGRNESNGDVLRKVQRGITSGLTVIVCVGETEQEMVGGSTEAVLRHQLEESLPRDGDPSRIIIAYEPIWAIGTGRVPTLERIAEVHGFVRATLSAVNSNAGSVRILYGGSVKPDNAGRISEIADVDGVLVGGASLNARDFLAIASAFAG